jgi:hypothetical protein
VVNNEEDIERFMEMGGGGGEGMGREQRVTINEVKNMMFIENYVDS